MTPTDIKTQWRESWKLALVVSAHLVDDPTIWLTGFTPRQQWSLLNRFRNGQGHCDACRKTWCLTDTDLCCCGETRRILPFYQAEWWSVSASLCYCCCYCLVDQLRILIAYARRRLQYQCLCLWIQCLWIGHDWPLFTTVPAPQAPVPVDWPRLIIVHYSTSTCACGLAMIDHCSLQYQHLCLWIGHDWSLFVD